MRIEAGVPVLRLPAGWGAKRRRVSRPRMREAAFATVGLLATVIAFAIARAG